MRFDMRYASSLLMASALAFLAVTGCSDKADVERARAEAEKAKSDLERARAEAEKAKAEAARVQAELELYKLKAAKGGKGPGRVNPKQDKAPRGTKARVRIVKCDDVIYYGDKAPLVEVRLKRENYEGPVRVRFSIPVLSFAGKSPANNPVPRLFQDLSVSYTLPSGEDKLNIDVGRCIDENIVRDCLGSSSHRALISVSPTLAERESDQPSGLPTVEDAKKINELTKMGRWPERCEKEVRLVLRGRK
jgi:hypothetical protein